MIQRDKVKFRFTILKRFHSGPTVIAILSTLLHFRFTNLTYKHRKVCKMASNELQPGANAQCPPVLMRVHRFELSAEAFHFYGSAEVLYGRGKEFYGRATFLRNSDGLYYGRARFLRKNLATVSIEQLSF